MTRLLRILRSSVITGYSSEYPIIAIVRDMREYMSIINAKRYEENDRRLIIRRYFNLDEATRCWRWCHPADGGVHGTHITKYVEFSTLEDAIESAFSHGYTYEIETK